MVSCPEEWAFGGRGGQGLYVLAPPPNPIHVFTHVNCPPCLQTPSSDFWKELRLALPRKVQYRSMEGDPQTRLQDDKDPMLIVRSRLPEGRTLDPELDPDPEGDLGRLTSPTPDPEKLTLSWREAAEGEGAPEGTQVVGTVPCSRGWL